MLLFIGKIEEGENGVLECSFCNREIIDDNYTTHNYKSYHNTCYLLAQEKIELEDYICEIFNYTCLPPKIESQLSKYINTLGYTYSGILGSLVYWFEIRQASTVTANGGIGIVPYIYEEAKEYYRTVAKAHDNIMSSRYEKKVRNIEIHSPTRNVKKIKSIDLDFLEKGQCD